MDREDLESKPNLEWFDTICTLLTKENTPSTQSIIKLIGDETQIAKDARGSRFLKPYDKRFTWAAINPDTDEDLPLDFLAFGGAAFELRIADLIERFPTYKLQSNIYDGGTQIFFYPIDEKFEFSGISSDLSDELEDIRAVEELNVHSICFLFGQKILLGRDGYHLRR